MRIQDILWPTACAISALAVATAHRASAGPIGRRNWLPTVGQLTASALLLFSSPAVAFKGEVTNDVFTGCVRPDGLVRNLQRGDEPRRKCSAEAEEVRFAEIPTGLAVVSWDIALAIGEEFSPTPGIEMICSGDPVLYSELQITINGEVVVDIITESIGRERSFVFHGDDNQPFTGPFLVRASGIGATLYVQEEELPCESVGFAETFDWTTP